MITKESEGWSNIFILRMNLKSEIMSYEEQDNELGGVLKHLHAPSLSLDVAICHNFISKTIVIKNKQ
jgi:hypothetical protein